MTRKSTVHCRKTRKRNSEFKKNDSLETKSKQTRPLVRMRPGRSLPAAPFCQGLNVRCGVAVGVKKKKKSKQRKANNIRLCPVLTSAKEHLRDALCKLDN